MMYSNLDNELHRPLAFKVAIEIVLSILERGGLDLKEENRLVKWEV